MGTKNTKKKSKWSYGEMYLHINNSSIELNKINNTVINSIMISNKKNYISKHNNKLLIKNNFFSHEVENVYRYSIIIKNGTFTLFRFEHKDSHNFINSNYNDRSVNVNSNLKSIIILVESPHKDEFDSSFKGIAPAQGTTGIYIKKYIRNIIKEIYRGNSNKIPDGKYRIIIINPIPCQTSLYNLHNKSLSGSWETLRDKVWTALWENNIQYQNNLINAVNAINPIVIINSCTSHIKTEILNPFLRRNFSSYILYQTDHPSSWYTGINLKTL